MGHGVIFKISM